MVVIAVIAVMVIAVITLMADSRNVYNDLAIREYMMAVILRL